MKRVLLTGMSGTGKSTVTTELSARGYCAVDADTEEWSHWVSCPSDDVYGSPVEPGRDWVWQEDKISSLLDEFDGEYLFLSGCAANMTSFYSRFDVIILLSAPPSIITERLAIRTTNPYGKNPAEVARVLNLIKIVEPLLRKRADHEINTAAPLPTVIESILGIVQTPTLKT